MLTFELWLAPCQRLKAKKFREAFSATLLPIAVASPPRDVGYQDRSQHFNRAGPNRPGQAKSVTRRLPSAFERAGIGAPQESLLIDRDLHRDLPTMKKPQRHRQMVGKRLAKRQSLFHL